MALAVDHGQRDERRSEESGGGRALLLEAPGDPDQREEDNEQPRALVAGGQQHRAHQQGEQSDGFSHLKPVEGAVWAAQRPQDWCHQYDAHGVSGPPHQPAGAEVAGRHRSGEDETGGAEGGTDSGGCGARGQQGEGIPGPGQLSPELEPAKQPHRNDGSGRVAHGDAGGRDGRRADRDVNGERGQGQGWPQAVAPRQDCRHGDSGGRP